MPQIRQNPDPTSTRAPFAAALLISNPLAVIMLRDGESGYWSIINHASNESEALAIVHNINTALGTSKAQAAALFAGSMFGFKCPAADPATYDIDGNMRHAATA